MNIFGSNLKKFRLNRSMTQGDLAEALNISRSSVSMYENGEREPDFETLELIADYFNVDMNHLLGSETNQEYDPDVEKILEAMEKNKELKILFDKTKDYTPEQIKRIAKIIDLTIGEE